MRGKFCWKFFILIMDMAHAYMFLSILLAMLVWNMWLSRLFYISFLAYCSALCLFEKHMLEFVDLIHALPTRGRKTPNLFCITRGRKGGGNACRGGFPTACILVLGALYVA
jgi:hypothetical protein